MESQSAPFGFTRRDFLAGAASGAAASVLARSASAGDAIRITTPSPGSAGTIWRVLLEQRGSGGLNLQWTGAPPGQGQIQLSAGTVDVAYYGGVGIAQSVLHGADLVIFGPALNNHGRWVVRGNSPYHAPRDLIGKKIATQPESSETFLHARMAAATVGIDLKRDCELFLGPPTANVALFDRGDVDAVIALEPTATRLVGAGARQIARVGDMWREGTGDSTPLFLVGLAARRSWLNSNRAAAQTLVRLFTDIHRDLNAHPRKFAALHEALAIPASEKGAIALLPERLADVYACDWGQQVFTDIDRQIAYAVKTGILKSAPGRSVYATA